MADRTKEIKEAFALYDTKKEGKVPSKQLGAVLRSLGFTPSEADVAALVKEFDKGNKGAIEFKDFETIVKRKSDKPTEQMLKTAFQALDKEGNGFVSASDLRHALGALGEKFTNEELDEIVKEIKLDSDGQFNYEELVKDILSVAA